MTTAHFMVAVRGYSVHLLVRRSGMKSVLLWADKASEEDTEEQRYTHRQILSASFSLRPVHSESVHSESVHSASPPMDLSYWLPSV